METFIHLITGLGVLAILLVIFAESGLLIGFVFPGDSLLFTAGYMVQQGILPINVHLFVALLFIAAVLGDNVGYAFGNRVGKKFFEKENSRFFKKKYLEQAEKFYKKHGSSTIVLARFVPIVRTFAPIVAGASSMHYRTFVVFNLVGGLVWTATFTYLGFFAGKALTSAGINIEAAALIVIFISILPMIIHGLMQKNVQNSIKKQFRVIFSKVSRNKKKK